MRVNLSKSSSTKAERLFAEILKRNHIPFKHRVKIEGKEIDFLIGNYAIEIDGHSQESIRNTWLFSQGLIPIHYTNNALRTNLSAVEEDIRNKYDLFNTKVKFRSSNRESI